MNSGQDPALGQSAAAEPELPEQKPWSRKAQAMAAVVWPSFLAACLATMLFFAFVDPQDLQQAMAEPLEFTRMTGYGLGFFFFWLIALVSSAVSVFLLRTARRNSRDKDSSS
jgi:hypothetical protein